MATPESEGPDTVPRLGRLRAMARRRLPPTRLLWLLLALLAAYGVGFLATGIGIATAVGLPLLAAVLDLAYQRVRFSRSRFPDAAVATGLFLAVLLPPAVPLVAAAAATVAAITLRHTLRLRGRPWFNPAAAGVMVGTVFFGIAPAWWGSISEPLVVGLGIALVAFQRTGWRLSSTFLGTYAAFAVAERLVLSAATGALVAPNVVLLTALDPTILFFGLFMVLEPRTAPSTPLSQVVFAIVVAALAATLPLELPALALIVALLLGNLLAVAFRGVASTRGAAPEGSSKSKGGPRGASGTSFTTRARASSRWSVGRRVGAGFLVFVLVGTVALAMYTPSSSPGALLGQHPGGGGTPVSSSLCRSDSGAIPSSTLQSLHKTLGPSVVLSYNSDTGVVVFYDPVNSVTVTETDLYEDYGFAEFNGDDYTSVGCVLP